MTFLDEVFADRLFPALLILNLPFFGDPSLSVFRRSPFPDGLLLDDLAAVGM